MDRRNTGFTLLEVIVVLLILSILATLGVSMSSGSKESSIDKVAIANLKLIQTAEKTKMLVDGEYVPGLTTSDLNSALRIALPTGGGSQWSYKAEASGSAFTAKAQRNGGDGRVKCIRQDDPEPYSSGCTW